MRIIEIRLELLEVPLRTSLATGTGERTSVRLGLLHLGTDAGLEGLAEVPLEGAPGVYVVSDARRVAALGANVAASLPARVTADRKVLGTWVDGLMARLATSGSLDPTLAASLRSALWTAAADVLARGDGLSLAAWLAGGPWSRDGLRVLGSPPSGSVIVNALLGIGEPTTVAAEAHRLVRAGFSCLKLKGGVEPRGQMARRIAAVRDAVGPAIALRLDLNGSLDEASALELLPELAPYGLEYVEQPIPASAGVEALARLRRKVGVLVAADEAVTDVAALERLARAGAVDAVIVKPSRVGGLPEAARMVELAVASDTRVTVSTLFESGVGVAAALHLAATVPGQVAHGLSTSGLLTADLLDESLAIRGGRLAVPQGPGLGVAVDGASVARFRIAETTAHA
jgi:L-alanine-DL-glutamate epimerase-like enolase superfamily enzyme